MSNTYSVTIPMVTHLKVPVPLDSEGRPLPATYEVKAFAGGARDPAERRIRLGEEFQRRLTAFESWLTGKGDRNVAVKVWAIRGFIDFVMDPEKYGFGAAAAASPSPAPTTLSVQPATVDPVPAPDLPAVAEAALPPETSPAPVWNCAFAPWPTTLSSRHHRYQGGTARQEDRPG